MKMQQFIEKHWYIKTNLLISIILFPLCCLFFIISRIRFYLYQFNLFKSYHLRVPVVVIGNISVGGAGKTPLTKYLATELQRRGIKVGVILRGYKSKTVEATVVTKHDTSDLVGDEALIYAMNNIRVAIGRDRYSAGLALLKQYPDTELILTDDGLQHYKLQRDYEIAVIDSTRMFGNNYVLPMGPLRETRRRLESVNMLVLNGIPTITQLDSLKKYNLAITLQNLVLDKIYNPITGDVLEIKDLQHKNVIAMAAIGNPQRFFNFIRDLGIQLKQAVAFPDHHNYKIIDIPLYSDIILVTEKDYAKLIQFNNVKIWVVLVKTELNSSILLEQISKLAQQVTKNNNCSETV